jgi:hypothetical protein
LSEKYRPNPFFNGVSTFKTAFPMLSDALVEWRERRGPEDTTGAELRRTGFKRGNFTQGVIPCSNPACHEGGYELDRLVAAMLREEQMEREGRLLCSGREISEETRRGPTRCPNRIEYRATLALRTPEPENPEGARTARRPFRRRGRNRPPRAETVA